MSRYLSPTRTYLSRIKNGYYSSATDWTGMYFEKVLVQVVGGARATKSLLLTYVYGGPEGSHMQIKNVAAN